MSQNDLQGNRNSEPSFGFEPIDFPSNIKEPGSPYIPEPTQQNFQTNQEEPAQSQAIKNSEDMDRKSLGDSAKKIFRTSTTKIIIRWTIGITFLIIGATVFFMATSVMKPAEFSFIKNTLDQEMYEAMTLKYSIFQWGGVLAVIVSVGLLANNSRLIGIVLSIIGVFIFFWAASRLTVPIYPDMGYLKVYNDFDAVPYRIYQVEGGVAALVGGIVLLFNWLESDI